MFDSADVYSQGMAEEILGQAIKGKRDKLLISTKATFRNGTGPNDVGSSRLHLIQTIDASLRRLGTDYIDLFQLHAFDALTPIEEVLTTLDDLVRAGKIRYLGCSNFSGWHLMKSLAIADRYGLTRYVAHQAYYSLVGRDYEWELMPLGVDQKGRRRRLESPGMGAVDRKNPTADNHCLKRVVCKVRWRTMRGRKFPTNICSVSSTRSTRLHKKRERRFRKWL